MLDAIAKLIVGVCLAVALIIISSLNHGNLVIVVPAIIGLMGAAYLTTSGFLQLDPEFRRPKHQGDSLMTEPLARLLVTVRNYFDLRKPDAGVRPLLATLLELNRDLNVRYMLIEPRLKFVVSVGLLVLLLLLAHSGSTLSIVLAVVAALVVVAGWGVFAFVDEGHAYAVVEDALFDNEEALEAVPLTDDVSIEDEAPTEAK